MVNLAPTKLQARVSTAHYHAGNTLPGTNASFYNIRDTNNKIYDIPMAKAGVVDMGLALNHTLTAGGADVDCWVQIIALMDLAAVGGTASAGSTILFYTQPGVDELKTNGRWWVLPEASVGTTTATTRQISLPELRAPIDALRLYIKARTVPDAGQFSLRVVSRY